MFTSLLIIGGISIEICNVAVVILYEKHLLDRLHWQMLHNDAGNSDSHYLLALATLGVAT